MKTRNDKQDIIFYNEKQRVGEAAQKGATHVFEDNRELQRVGAHTVGRRVNRLAKAAA